MLAVQLLNGRTHDRTDFDCGEPSLNHYLRDRAAQHHRAGVATTHVLIEESRPGRILGFYSLAAAQLLLSDLSDWIDGASPGILWPLLDLLAWGLTCERKSAAWANRCCRTPCDAAWR